MTVKELRKLLDGLPESCKVEIYASSSDGELAIDLVEYYEPGVGGTVMLMDKGCDVAARAKVLWDMRDGE